MAFEFHCTEVPVAWIIIAGKLARFGGMVDSIMDQTCSKEIKMETIMFHRE
jgi:hypothetical protein